jgi:hypothetical protein
MYVGQAFSSDHNMRFVETAVFFRCIVSCHSINIFVLHGTRKVLSLPFWSKLRPN